MPLDIDLLSSPIEPTAPDFAPLLAHLQGNILKSHGRNHTVDLFLTFRAGKQDEVKEWIGDFSRRYVTSAIRQLHESAEFKANGLSGRIFATVSLSAAGYRYLEYDTNAFVEKRDPALTTGVTFAAGMKAATSELKDPAPEDWEFGAGDIHLLVLLADEDPKRLQQVLDRIKEDLDEKYIVEHQFEQPGVGIRDESNQPLEHFGYRDGVSQPLFYEKDVVEERERFGTSQWDPSAALGLALVLDPFAPAPESFGSYLVYRKIEQDVLKFKTLEKGLATALGLQGLEEERAGALVVGRFENGVPVERSGSEQAVQLRDFNDFNYHDDLKGARCPFQAHIRKTNPRGDTARVRIPGLDPAQFAVTDTGERGRRITRRGITYGDRVTNAEGQLIRPELTDAGTLHPPIEEEVGLLFQCYQASIPDQFGFMQKAWANAVDFANPTPPDFTGIDPIIGQTFAADVNAQAEDFADGSPATPLLHQWPLRYDDASTKAAFNFGDVVRLRGGEFFFTPSVPFLTGFGKANRSVQGDLAEQERRIIPSKTAE